MNLPNNNVNDLIVKYTPILEQLKEKDRTYEILSVLDYTINYVKNKYPNLNKDLKTWSTIVTKNMFFVGKIKLISDIDIIVDEFVLYWNNEYENYLNNIGVYSSEYYRDIEFINIFINNKIIAN